MNSFLFFLIIYSHGFGNRDNTVYLDQDPLIITQNLSLLTRQQSAPKKAGNRKQKVANNTAPLRLKNGIHFLAKPEAVYAAPTQTAGIIAKLPVNSTIRIISNYGLWSYVEVVPSGQKGYVPMSVLK